jgi:hypothetical protein
VTLFIFTITATAESSSARSSPLHSPGSVTLSSVPLKNHR